MSSCFLHVHQTDSGHFKVDFQIPSRFDVTPSSFPTQEGNQKEFSQGLFQRSTLIYRWREGTEWFCHFNNQRKSSQTSVQDYQRMSSTVLFVEDITFFVNCLFLPKFKVCCTKWFLCTWRIDLEPTGSPFYFSLSWRLFFLLWFLFYLK